MRCVRSARRVGQRGAVLGIVLVLLVAGSVLGITSMRVSIIEEKIVRNYTGKETAFRAADLAAQGAVDEPGLASALAAGSGKTVEADLTWTDERVQLGGSISAEGTGLARGYSLGPGGFLIYRFRARGVAKMDGVAATSVVEQGIERLSPSPGR